jgi:Transcriptional regulator
MDLSIRRIKQFVALAEEQHFGRAAARLNMAQPPLSQSIKRLEEELGIKLFDRTRGGAVLTRAGEVFLYEARKIIFQTNLAVTVAKEQASKDMVRSSLRIGFISPAGYRLLPPLLASFKASSPGVKIELSTRGSMALSRMIQEGELDVAFIRPLSELMKSHDDRMLVERTPHVCATATDDPRAVHQQVTLGDLSRQPLIFTPADRSPELISRFLAAFSVAEAVPEISQEAATTDHAILLVRAGLGYSLVPATVAHCRHSDIRLIPISGLPSNTAAELFMVWNPRNISEAGARFVGHVHNALKDNDKIYLSAESAMEKLQL